MNKKYQPTEREIKFRMAICHEAREQALAYFETITYAETYAELGGVVREVER